MGLENEGDVGQDERWGVERGGREGRSGDWEV